MREIKANAHVLMLLSILIASSSVPIGKLITYDLPPAVMMLMRFLLSAVLFAPYVFIKKWFGISPTEKNGFLHNIEHSFSNLLLVYV